MTENGGGARVQEMTRELDSLLTGISQRISASAQEVSLLAAVAPSGRLYGAITRHWPRIAAGLVGLSVLLAFVLGSVEVGRSLDFYVFAWASTTGGPWFLFDKAEKALSDESRARVVGWVKEADLESTLASIPAQFALLFDRIFGEKHLSRHCFNRRLALDLRGRRLCRTLPSPHEQRRRFPALSHRRRAPAVPVHGLRKRDHHLSALFTGVTLGAVLA